MANEKRRVRRKRRSASAAPGAAGLVNAHNAIFAAAVCVAFALSLLALIYAPRAYGSWAEERLLARAAAMLEKGDLEGATRAAQDMLARQPDSLAAFRVLAEATEKQNRSETVAWRAQVAQANPHNLDAQLNLASAALRFGQLDTAAKALDNVAPPDREQAAFHVVAGWLARAQGNEKEVEQHFAAALEREPANELYQFNLAVLRLRSVDPEIAAAARATIERLSKGAEFRTGSLRALLSDAIEREDLARADTLAQDLQMTQQVTFADYLLCLDFYRKLDAKKFTVVLEKIKPVAARHKGDLGLLLDWMIQNGQADEVLRWVEKLPAELTTVAPPAVSVAEAYAVVKNWSRLRRWTRSGQWGAAEYLRFAYQAYSVRQARQNASNAEFDSLWALAERSASESPEREANLARLAQRWGLGPEAEVLWQRVAKHPPKRREALDALARIYRGKDDLPHLLQVAKQLHESSPREPGLTANYARLALLLEPSTEQAQRKAREAYEAAPQDVNCAVTYAFALYGLGRTSEGLKILDQVPHQELLDSHLAAYAAVLLLDDEKPGPAQEFIAATKAGPLFPEEKKLLDEAVTKSAAAPASSATPTPSPTAVPASSP